MMILYIPRYLTQERERMIILYIPRAHWAGKIQQQRAVKGLVPFTGVAGSRGLRLNSAQETARERDGQRDTHTDRDRQTEMDRGTLVNSATSHLACLSASLIISPS